MSQLSKLALAAAVIGLIVPRAHAQRRFAPARPTYNAPALRPIEQSQAQPVAEPVKQTPRSRVNDSAAQPPKPTGLPARGEVDTFEIARLGDRVVVTGQGPRSADDVLFALAMQPPADDSDRWQLTVFGPSKDSATLALVKAFEQDANLAPFIATPPSGTPWAHFQFLQTDNSMQRSRFSDWGIDPTSSNFPIVTVQPPRNGNFSGIKDGRAVVIDRIDAARLSPHDVRRRITGSVTLWCKKLAQSGFVPPAKIVKQMYGDEDVQLALSDSHGQQFPWGPQTPPPTQPVNAQWPVNGPAVDPTPAPSGALLKLLVSLIPNASTVFLFLTALSNMWLLWREFATKAGIQLMIDEATFQRVKEILSKFAIELPAPKG